MFSFIKFTKDNLTEYLRVSDNTGLLILAVVVGLATGIGISAFQFLIELFHDLFSDVLENDVLSPVFGSASIIISLAIGGWIVGTLMNRFVGEERHHGVAGVIESVALAGGHLAYRLMPFKALASAISLGAGASVGPEDPSVQIGANLGSWLGQFLHLKEEGLRLLVAAGVASAIATAFEAPIAGVFFALEVILNGSLRTSYVGVVVLAAVVSSAFTQAIELPSEIVHLTYTLGNPIEIILFVPLGILLAPIASGFIRLVYWQHHLWQRHIHLSKPAKTAFTGAIVGIAGIAYPEILGTGRETMNSVLSGETELVIGTLLALGLVKMLLTSVSMAGGFVGGIFAPALFVGTMFGSVYGNVMETVLGGSLTDPSVYAVAGMAGMMAGIVRSPITAIILVFELTNDYRLILPIMLTTVVCVVFSERFQKYGVYRESLERAGVHLSEGRDIDLMQGVQVKEAMLKPAPSISEKATLTHLRDQLRIHKTLSLCVVDDDGLLCGIATLSDLQRAYDRQTAEGEVDAEQLYVKDICTHDVITTSPNDAVWTAIQMMSAYDIGRLPVVETGTRKLVGLIGRHGVVRAYNLAISRKLQDQHTAERIRLHTLTGAHVYEVHIGRNAPIVGKIVSEVAWPHESVVASIQRKGKLILPHGSTKLYSDDLLTIVADPSVAEEIEKLTGTK